ncbi:uncharacterized protein TEOVI_000158500 [Trypanosoma equiperdum]|uniref:Secreted protein n=2 Tax=Trypanozoon TaxID=39700 RepID=Q385X6_TRYB2|nr:hypothetical protein, unlikely [Trypanosoma brucei brucei TREU927]EAN79405.1 hypothetical protein, unlikely [Trypanosoma brucei brucei TREU927]SCU70016.1 hypothetical protein, conserved [Trypanosoma equiperdum]
MRFLPLSLGHFLYILTSRCFPFPFSCWCCGVPPASVGFCFVYVGTHFSRQLVNVCYAGGVSQGPLLRVALKGVKTFVPRAGPLDRKGVAKGN